jgi:hypothetical protein
MKSHKQYIGYNIISKTIMNNSKNREKEINIIKAYFNKINKNLISNCLFYKDFSFNFKITNYSKNKFNSSSASIIKHPNLENKFIMNTRIVNYALDTMGKSNSKDKCISINKVSIIDNFFNEVHFKYLFSENFNSKYVGIEDIRLFNFKNEIYFIGSFYNYKINKVQIVSNKYIYSKNYEPIIINPTFKTNFNWEKNWVFFNNNEELNIIYKWSPIYICKIDYLNKELNLIKSIEKLPDIFQKFRGSTNGVLHNDKVWFIVHQQNEIIEGIKNYIHNFVVFDKNMNLQGYSYAFNFENNLVEFCVGFELTHNDNFAITYSTLDSFSKLVVFSPNYINSLINYII